ncbi:Porphobilinogen deaminase [Colletotrichum sidae]|uniref:Porphobilinogen deaminase n=4 Tax=Colletotrichum orbiculare species complex TaxID=2707354 RepID=N4VNZ1_COLOR|nr:Porphobilinogen deaminase [Colletotrichum orbiculare MAFF 240422]TDZ31273.1 Porphobilinogen deaminase [Colletotrichum spinosum]TDZ59862.1 Porphobilinogen deaminase [Colletotrichum trifolii]TEA22234.1 Porphobilinogen deaminase [Colletotrichum sidae]
MADNGAPINVGTRRSALALKQTDIVVEGLKALRPSATFEVHPMQTLGDKDQITALYNFGGKGLWTNELEARLEAREIDIIVHSLKDMPTTLPEGLLLGCVTVREDPRDVVVFKAGLAEKHGWKSIADLPDGSVVGTSSIRRIAQLKRRYPGLKFADVRGNIETRLRKCDDPEGPFSAIILAAAGLLRMDYGARISQYLESENGGILHAVGQGAIGVEARAGDERVMSLLKEYEHRPTMLACVAERSLMRTLEGGCSVPIGVETKWTESEGQKKLRLKATVVHTDGQQGVDAERLATVETVEEAEDFGKLVAQDLVDGGAQDILDVINSARPATDTAPTAPNPTLAA